MDKARKIASGNWEFMGWEIERVVGDHWNMKKIGEEFWSTVAQRNVLQQDLDDDLEEMGYE